MSKHKASKYKVSLLGPPAEISPRATGTWESQFEAHVTVEPPIRIGAQLGRIIGGIPGNIIISEVASTQEITHLTIACARGRESYSQGAEAVKEAGARLNTYLNSEVSEITLLMTEFANEPLLAGHSRRQM